MVMIAAVALGAALASGRAFAQAAPESTDYQDPSSGGFVDALTTGANRRHHAASFQFFAHQAERHWPLRRGNGSRRLAVRRNRRMAEHAVLRRRLGLRREASWSRRSRRQFHPQGSGPGGLLDRGRRVCASAPRKPCAHCGANFTAIRMEPRQHLSLLQPVRRRLHRPARRARHDSALVPRRIGDRQSSPTIPFATTAAGSTR